ncbi:hypothetical protein EDD11_002689 [Mortierella claussenii]|nr:hypothetical protein EDD11_002689 [Mortierella claussenii]
MAPKQKASDAGQSSSSGNKSSNNNSGDRQGNSERGHGHANGATSDRGGSGNMGAIGNDRSSGVAGGSSGAHGGEKEKSSHSGSGTGTKRKAETPIITVEFTDMDMPALRRYCRLNKLKPKTKSRDDLVTAAAKHWNSVNAKELDSVAYFLFAVKHRRK